MALCNGGLEIVAVPTLKSAASDRALPQGQIQGSDLWLPLLLRPLLIVIVGIFLTRSLIAQERDGLTIELDPSTDSASVRVDYYLTGGFGGYGDLANHTQLSGREVVLPTYRNGLRARSLKAIVYVKGCAFSTFVLDPLPPGPSHVRFECQKLPAITLKGIVIGYPRPSELTVRLRYMASWSLTFFGASDGPVLLLPIAETVPDVDGRFAIEVPDFANDAVTNSYRRQAEWLITAWGQGANGRYWLNTDNEQPVSPGRLAIEREYPKELRFLAKQF